MNTNTNHASIRVLKLQEQFLKDVFPLISEKFDDRPYQPLNNLNEEDIQYIFSSFTDYNLNH